ncbi:MAG TPA: hypothetical protein ENH15_03315, partial [Actinobacteria bacterium]|nr:hypothetical protein [Actinomycetota bacterium]
MDVWARLLPLLLLGGIAFAVWWWTSRMRAANPDVLTVVKRTALLRGATVAVVEVADRHFLIGATEHSVNLLAELDDDGFVGADANNNRTEPWTDLFARARTLVRGDDDVTP